MIGKPEWFKYRIFGWGLAPKTWQGWVYVAVFVGIIGLITAIAINEVIKMYIYFALIGILILDVIHIMMNMDKVNNERKNYHQLIIERNCSFAAVGALIGLALYQAYKNRELIESGVKTLPFDYSIIIVFGVMLAVKIGSTIYVKMKK